MEAGEKSTGFRGKCAKIFQTVKNRLAYWEPLIALVQRNFRKSPKTIGVLAGALLIVVAGLVYMTNTTNAVQVVINDQNIGYAATVEEAEQIVDEALIIQGDAVGIDKVQTDDRIGYNKVRISKQTLAKNQLAADMIATSITPYIDACVISIGEEFSVVVADRVAANEILAAYKEYYLAPQQGAVISTVAFQEAIVLEEEKVHPSKVRAVDEVLAELTEGKAGAIEYEVLPEDSLWLIARKNDMLIDDILKANPGMSEDDILLDGQIIELAALEPYLTVVTTGQKVQTESIAYGTVTQTDSTMTKGRTVVKQEGQNGEKIVTVSYVEHNGQVIDKTTLQEEIVKQPVDKVVVEGTAAAVIAYSGSSSYAVSRGSGTTSGMVWPLYGPINSPYGYRNGSFHSGVDIGGSTGASIVSAASGTVSFAGWSGNYGYMVLIDHGNGVATRYAHCSKLGVSSGQKVSQGQTIGYVGSTGNSTGPHLHYEVIINGQTVNPNNYR